MAGQCGRRSRGGGGGNTIELVDYDTGGKPHQVMLRPYEIASAINNVELALEAEHKHLNGNPNLVASAAMLVTKHIIRRWEIAELSAARSPLGPST